jgi:hypothetical protein
MSALFLEFVEHFDQSTPWKRPQQTSYFSNITAHPPRYAAYLIPSPSFPHSSSARLLKGSAFEREAVVLLQQRGLPAQRVPLSGSVKTSRFAE